MRFIISSASWFSRGRNSGDEEIFHYNRQNASALTAFMKSHPEIVLPAFDRLPVSRSAPSDGGGRSIAILKVGPALTFSLREGLALSMMEAQLVPKKSRRISRQCWKKVMLQDPANWQKHYHGSEEELKIKRAFSFSDRCRYYFAKPEITGAIDKLFANLREVKIPLSMLRQYMPGCST